MSDVPYCRKQLAFILKAVREGSRSSALDAIQRLADGLDHLEVALKPEDAPQSEAEALLASLKRVRALEMPFVPVDEGGMGLDYVFANITQEANATRNAERRELLDGIISTLAEASK